VMARALLTLLFLLAGLGICVGVGQGGAISEEHMMSTTLMVEAMMLALTWLIGLSTFFPLWAIVIMVLFLVFLGIQAQRQEGGGY